MYSIKKILIKLLLVICIFINGCEINNNENNTNVKKSLSYDAYTLEKVVVLSRHNIRSPLSTKGSSLDTITPHKWFDWTSDPSDLSLRGGVLETEMGQYFRRWLEEESLFPEDYLPSQEEVRIYANSKQRTIATANYFKTGLLPISDFDVEYHGEFDTMDPVFNPVFTTMSGNYANLIAALIKSEFNSRIANLEDNYKLLSRVIDVEKSEDYKNGNFTGFSTSDTKYAMELNKEPSLMGSLKLACSISDALILQYYETNYTDASFGKRLTHEEWEAIAEIKDTYQDVLFTTSLVAENIANPLLKEILSELNNDTRKFTFLCGHDSNLGSVLAALQVEKYSLENSLEKKTPIGSKVVFSKWKSKDNKEYISVDMVYQTEKQLRGLDVLDINNPPSIMPIRFLGLEYNEDGLCDAKALENRFIDVINLY